MPLTSEDLLAPSGEIEAALFPQDSAAALADRLTAFLADAYTKVADITDEATKDAAARAWAYYRAFRAVFIRLSAGPSSVMLNDQGSRSYTVAQIENFGKMAEEYRLEFLGWLPVEATASAPRQAGSASKSITFTW